MNQQQYPNKGTIEKQAINEISFSKSVEKVYRLGRDGTEKHSSFRGRVLTQRREERKENGIYFRSLRRNQQFSYIYFQNLRNFY